jgi:predicted nucleic acid-binding protein
MPADRIFLDTNGWLALLNASDSQHSAASAAWAFLKSTLDERRRHSSLRRPN